jgi:hypothetical protein
VQVDEQGTTAVAVEARPRVLERGEIRRNSQGGGRQDSLSDITTTVRSRTVKTVLLQRQLSHILI